MIDPSQTQESEEHQRTYLRQFIRWLLVIILAYALFDTIMAVIYRDLAIAISGCFFYLYGGLLLIILSRLTLWTVGKSSIWVGIGLLVLATLITVAFPTASNGTAIIPLGAVAMLLPYHRGMRLLRMIIAAGFTTLAITLMGEIVPSWTTAPAWLIVFYRVNSAPIGAIIVLILLWQFHQRLLGLLEQIQRTELSLDDGAQQLRYETDVRKQAENELVTLREIAMFAVDAKSKPQLFEQVANRLDAHITLDLLSIWLLDEASQSLHFVARHYHGKSPDWDPPKIPLHVGVIGTVAATGEAMRIPDVSKEPLYLSAYFNSQSELCVPMRIGDQVIGVINAESSNLDAFREADEQLLASVASHLAIAFMRLQTQEELQISEERLQQAVRAGNIGIFDHDHITDTIYWSPGQRRIYGWNNEDKVTLAGFLKHVHPEDSERIGKAVQRAHDPSGDGSFDVEHRIIDRNGKTHWLNTRSRTLFEGEGQDRHPARTVGAVEDITYRKDAEMFIKENEERLQQAVRVSNIGIYDHDHLTDTLYWNSEQRKNYGWGEEEIVTLPKFLERIHPDDLPKTADAVRRAHDPAGDGLFDIEYRIIHRNGEIRTHVTRSQTLFEGEGSARHPVRTVGAEIDITDRIRMDEALRESRNLLQTVLNTIPVRVFWKDRNLRYLGCNLPFSLDAGLDEPHQLIGKDDYQMTWRDQAELYQTDDRLVMEFWEIKTELRRTANHAGWSPYLASNLQGPAS